MAKEIDLSQSHIDKMLAMFEDTKLHPDVAERAMEAAAKVSLTARANAGGDPVVSMLARAISLLGAINGLEDAETRDELLARPQVVLGLVATLGVMAQAAEAARTMLLGKAN